MSGISNQKCTQFNFNDSSYAQNGPVGFYNQNDQTKISLNQRQTNRIKIVPASTLARHEFTIKEKEDKLLEKMLEAGFFTYAIPSIELDVSSQSAKKFMILDGHHRFACLLRLNIQNIPIILYDYPSINIGAFFARSNIAWEHVSSVASVCQIECSYEQGLELLNQSKTPFMMVKKQGSGLIYSVFSPQVHAIDLDHLIESKQSFFNSISNYYSLEFIPQDQFELSNLMSNEVLFIQRPYSHSEVISRASRDLVFPQKSTRHHLPYNVNVGLPLQILQDWSLQLLNQLQGKLFEFAQYLN